MATKLSDKHLQGFVNDDEYIAVKAQVKAAHDTLHNKVIPYPKSTDEIPKGFRACLIEVKLSKRLE